MADTKLSGLTALTSVATNDYVEVLDVSDTVTMSAATGANKKVLQSDFLAGVYVQGGGTAVQLADGGTGATTANAARGSLGLGIGTAVQAWDADLDAFAGLTSGANLFPYYTGSGTMGTADFLNWGTWNGTWTGLGPGNPGGVGTATYQYAQIGKMVVARVSLLIGLTGTVGTNPSVSTPTTVDSTQTNAQIGIARLGCAGSVYAGHIGYNNTTSVAFKTLSYNAGLAGTAYAALTTPTATIPNTWAAGDRIDGQFVYRSA